MPWIPTEPLLGTVTEFQNFDYSIQYYEEVVGPGGIDATTGEATPGEVTRVYYPVTITPEIVKPTISSTTGNPGHVSGYYQYTFNDVIQYRDNNNNIVTLTGDATQGTWQKLNMDVVYQITSFRPDTSRDRTFNFTAIAKNGDTVVATTDYNIRVFDPSWTSGLNNLRAAIATIRARGL